MSNNGYRLQELDDLCHLKEEYDLKKMREMRDSSTCFILNAYDLKRQIIDLRHSLRRLAARYAADGSSGRAGDILIRACCTSAVAVDVPADVGMRLEDGRCDVEEVLSWITVFRKSGWLWSAIELQEGILNENDQMDNAYNAYNDAIMQSLFSLYDQFVANAENLNFGPLAYCVVLRRILKMGYWPAIAQAFQKYAMGSAFNDMSIAGWMLHIAAEDGKNKTLKKLIDSHSMGIDINAKGPDGWTPLHSAVYGGKHTTVELLIENGANVNSTTDNARRPLHMLSCYNLHFIGPHDVTIAGYLLRQGAQIDAQDTHGFSALHGAVQTGAKDLTRFLLQRGANANLFDKGGETPRELAKIRGVSFANVAALMRPHYAPRMIQTSG